MLKVGVGSQEGIDVPSELIPVVNIFYEPERRCMRKSRKRPHERNYYKGWKKPKRAKPEIDVSLYDAAADQPLD